MDKIKAVHEDFSVGNKRLFYAWLLRKHNILPMDFSELSSYESNLYFIEYRTAVNNNYPVSEIELPIGTVIEAGTTFNVYNKEVWVFTEIHKIYIQDGMFVVSGKAYREK